MGDLCAGGQAGRRAGGTLTDDRWMANCVGGGPACKMAGGHSGTPDRRAGLFAGGRVELMAGGWAELWADKPACMRAAVVITMDELATR